MPISKVTRLKRLTLLKKMLENHDKLFPCVKFNMSSWEVYLAGKGEMKKGHLCKTAACALGSAAMYPPFVKAGLHLAPDGEEDTNCSEPKFKHYESFDAGRHFFGITLSESNHLFAPTYYVDIKDITPAHVAKRVGELIKQYA